MSRSTRRPYTAVTGVSSAKQDKQRARQSVRTVEHQRLRTTTDYDTLLMPHRLECAWNDPWTWQRDGRKRRGVPPERSRSAGWYAARDPKVFDQWFEWQLRYYRKLHRK